MKTFLIYTSCIFSALFQQTKLYSQTLDEQFPAVNGTVNTICISGNTIYVGGIFTEVGGLPRTNIAAIDIPTKSVTDWAPHLNGDVADIGAANGKVYFCGHFTQVNSENRNALAAVDAETGSLDPLNPSITFPGVPGQQTGTVTSLEVIDNTFYFAGYFISVNGSTRTNVAAIDLSSGNLTSFSVKPDIPVNVIEIEGDILYMGGPFYKVNNNQRKGFASVNRFNGELQPWAPNIGNPGNTMYAILPDNEQVFIGGFFSGINGSQNCFLAKTDMNGAPQDWKPLPCSAVNPSARTMMKWETALIIGGNFADFGGESRKNLTMIDRNTGTVSDWEPNPDAKVLSLASNDSLLVVGGQFQSVSGASHSGLAVYHMPVGTPPPPPPPTTLVLASYPNPPNSSLSITLPASEIRSITVYDRNGKRIDPTYLVEGGVLTIQTGQLNNGQYVVQLQGTDGNRYVSSFMKID
jgi:hypothetical protein